MDTKDTNARIDDLTYRVHALESDVRALDRTLAPLVVVVERLEAALRTSTQPETPPKVASAPAAAPAPVRAPEYQVRRVSFAPGVAEAAAQSQGAPPTGEPVPPQPIQPIQTAQPFPAPQEVALQYGWLAQRDGAPQPSPAPPTAQPPAQAYTAREREQWPAPAMSAALPVPPTVPAAAAPKEATGRSEGPPAQAPVQPPEPAPTSWTYRSVQQVLEEPEPKPAPWWQVDLLGRSGSWLNKIGIALFLLGVAFLFKYSVDQGWLTEDVRVGIGLLLGAALLVIGFLIKHDHRSLSHVMMGGGIATFYITGFFASRVFHLSYVHYEVAFGFMIAVTALAYALAVTQDGLALAIVGTVGGLATPFLLYSGSGGVTGLVVYTCLVLAGAQAVYMYKGWRSLIWTAVVGGWTVMLLGLFSVLTAYPRLEEEQWALQGGAVFMLLAFWIVPVLREALWAADSARWRRPSAERVLEWAAIKLQPGRAKELYEAAHVHALATLVPLAVLGFSSAIWGEAAKQDIWGWCGLAGAALYGLGLVFMRRFSKPLAYTHGVTAVMLFTIGLVLIFQGSTLFFALAAEAVALHLLSWRLGNDVGTAIGGHLLSVVAVAWLGSRILDAPHADISFFSVDALVDLAVIASLLGVSFSVWPRGIATVYRGMGQVAIAGWLLRELYWLQDGYSYVLLAWAALALSLRVIAFKWKDRASDVVSHLVFGGAALVLASRFGLTLLQSVLSPDALSFIPHPAVPFFTIPSLIDLAALTMAAGASMMARGQSALLYRAFVHAGVLAFLWHELYWLENGYSYVLLAWALYALAIRLVANRWRELTCDAASHVTSAFAAVLLAGLLLKPLSEGYHPDLAFFNLPALINLVVIGIAIAISMLTGMQQRLAYRGVAHAAILGLLFGELYWLENGYSYVLLAWALYAAALRVIAAKWKEPTCDIASHVAFSAGAVLLAARMVLTWMFGYHPAVAVFTMPSLIDLAAIGAVLGSSLALGKRDSLIYRGFAHAGIVAWLGHELSTLPDGGNYMLLAWAAYGLGVHVLARRLNDRVIGMFGHSTFALAAWWMAMRLGEPLLVGTGAGNTTDTPFLNARGLVDLAVLAAAMASTLFFRSRQEIWTYRLAAHVGVLLLLLRELTMLPDGTPYVTAAWGAYTLVLLMIGVRLDLNKPVLITGLATLLVTVLKLVVIDMREVDEIWRILLFLAFGALLLALSYWFQNVTRRHGQGGGLHGATRS